MKNLGLQNIIMGIFVAAAVAAILVFSGFVNTGNRNDTSVKGSVLVWGTIPSTVMQKYVEQTKTSGLQVSYQVKDEATYESELVNAIAAGNGPDLFIMSHEQILRNKDKIFEVPFANFPRRDYTDRFIRESELFLTDTGILAIPLSVDPLVMYYNKSLLNSAFILDIPSYWDEVIKLAPALTVADGTGRITRSGIAMGTFDNIDDAKAILSTLLIQNGNRIVGTDTASGKYRSLLALNEDYAKSTEQAMNFYTSFANKNTANYSWNEALPDSLDMFIAGDLAFYIGRASELTDIRKKNPNLDFDVTFLPDLRDTTRRVTFGYLTGIAVSKQSANVAAALSVASSLSGADLAEDLTAEISQVPARNDLLKNKPEEAYATLFYNSAIIADGWIDPALTQTNELFRGILRNINAGALTVTDAITRAHTDLNTILDESINTTITDKNLANF